MALKLAGKSGGSTAKKGSTSKTAAAKPAKSKAASTRTKTATTNGRKRTADIPTSGPGSRPRRPTTDDAKVINSFKKRLTKAGEKRDRLYEEHKEAVEEMYEITREAYDAGVPTGVITEYGRISRQWLYKMGDHSGRDADGSGNGQPRKSAPAAAPKAQSSRRKPAANASTRKPATTKRRSSGGGGTKTTGARKIKIR